MIGQVIGSYRIVAELGRGGMGVVYRAEHVQLGRPAAIKVLLPQMSADRTMVQRFFNEARAASSIDHPGIAQVHDFGQHTDGRAYLVMELLRGESLDHRLMRPVAPLEAASLIAQVAGALAAAHARGIIHRDLKPDNIFLVPNELLPGGIQVKLLDFGIAKLADAGEAGFRTQTGVLIGTPAYMSPEQCMGRADLDHRTDLYAIGCILYHLLCGRPPFLSDHGTGVMIAMHLRDPVPDPRALAPHLPAPLVAITLRLLEKDPAARFASALELRQALVTAGAIAPMTAPGASPDPYGGTLASAPPPMGDASRGGHAYAVATASPTTRGGAAAELVTRPDRVHDRGAGSGGRRGAWIAVGALLLAGAGLAAVVAMSGGGDDGGAGSGEPVAAADPPDPGPPHDAAVVEEPAQAKPLPPDAGSAEPPCPEGQLRSEDTRGRCCWSGQAWSTAKQRCVGAPTCPPGMRAAREQCVAAPARVPPEADPTGATPRSGQRFRLATTRVPAGGKIRARFPGPLRAAPGERFWITVIEATAPDDKWDKWAYVPDGARELSLAVPSEEGTYEVRLHANYPKRATHVVHRARLRIVAP